MGYHLSHIRQDLKVVTYGCRGLYMPSFLPLTLKSSVLQFTLNYTYFSHYFQSAPMKKKGVKRVEKKEKINFSPSASESGVPIAYDEMARDPETMQDEAFESSEAAAAEDPEGLPPGSSEDTGSSEPVSREIIQDSQYIATEESESPLAVTSEEVVSPGPAPPEVSDVELARVESPQTAGESKKMASVQPDSRQVHLHFRSAYQTKLMSYDHSPYESEAATILIGRLEKRYTVPVDIVNRVPSLKCQTGLESTTVRLPDVDSDIGHTFIHYLYTGDYQTLNPSPGCNMPRQLVEYNRSVLVYQAAVSYGLDGLADHAKKYIQLFDEDVSIFHIIVLGRKTFPRITEASWFAEYLTTKIMQTFEEDEQIFQREEFFEGFGQAPYFDKFLGKVMATVYTHRIFSLRAAGLEASTNRLAKSVMTNGEQLGSDDTAPGQEAQDKLTSQSGSPPDLTQGASEVPAPSTDGDIWVRCEEDGNDTQVRVTTPSSSTGESSEDKRLEQASTRHSKPNLANGICSHWFQHSMHENLWTGCPKCKDFMLSMLAKLLLNNASNSPF